MIRRSLLAFALSLAIAGLPYRANARPAAIFDPYIGEIRSNLPAGWAMRLPSAILLDGPADAAFTQQLIVKVLASKAPPLLTVSLMTCETGASPCLLGSFSVDSQTSTSAQQQLARHRAAAAPISLEKGGRGYLVEGPSQRPPYPFSSVMWQQDGMIYTVTFPATERQNLLRMAYSMANSVPIQRLIVAPASLP